MGLELDLVLDLDLGVELEFEFEFEFGTTKKLSSSRELEKGWEGGGGGKRGDSI